MGTLLFITFTAHKHPHRLNTRFVTKIYDENNYYACYVGKWIFAAVFRGRATCNLETRQKYTGTVLRVEVITRCSRCRNDNKRVSYNCKIFNSFVDLSRNIHELVGFELGTQLDGRFCFVGNRWRGFRTNRRVFRRTRFF